ncbi:MAG: hypothetical protein FWH20_10460 [Oscillospiraceae bacterium]|nr:hypothetical protein [Oscillospiraceae bacterium]
MEIKNLNSRMIGAYKSIAGNPAKGKKESTGKTGGENFDKIEIDFDRSMKAAKGNIAAEVSAEAGAGRIESLQAAYDGDRTPVTSEQIADAIVG